MKHILFTKKDDEKGIEPLLGNSFSYDFLEVITCLPLSVEAFDLANLNLIFTSANAVETFFEKGFKVSVDQEIYCVGSKTQQRVLDHGFESYTQKNAEELARFIIKQRNYGSYLHFCSNLALPTLGRMLSSQEGFNYQQNIIYETRLLYPKHHKRYDALVFFSPSGVRSFVRHNALGTGTLFAIGETTAKELQQYTSASVHWVEEMDLNSLVKTIATQL